MLETAIILVLVVGAVSVLAAAWVSGRRGRDPSGSVATFNRAITALQRAAPEAPRDAHPDDEELARK